MDYGLLSVIPPLLAIVLAIATKDVLISLLLGLFSGLVLLHHGQPLSAAVALLDNLVALFAEAWAVKTLIFALLVGSIMRLLVDSGGVAGVVHFLTLRSRLVKSARAAQGLAFGIGVVIFIESSITSLVAGTVARPLFDHYGVSRQKLAYICDATSAPVCALVPLNGWGALLLGLISAQLSAGVIQGNAVDILLRSIPYNFYAWLSLMLVVLVIWRNWNVGAMLEFESGITPLDIAVPADGGHIGRMLLPLGVLVAMIPIALYATGTSALAAAPAGLAQASLLDKVFAGSGSSAVFYAVFTTLLVAFVQYVLLGSMRRQQFFDSVFAGAGELLPIVVILILAFLVGNMTKALHTGDYLASLAQGWISPGVIPVLVFLLSSLIAFATGTSWGTFSIMLPIGSALSAATGADIAMVIGAVVSGGVFGDHASPISDTTIISSLAAGCDVIEHTRTQLPYALLAGGAASVLFLVFGLLSH